MAVVDRVLRLNTPEPPNLFAGLDLLENNDNITSNIFIQSNQSSPVLDIMQGLHDRLYSKMFNS